MSLDTGKVISRKAQDYTALPTSKAVIEQVHRLAQRKTQKNMNEDLFEFKHSDGTTIEDDGSTLRLQDLNATRLGNQGTALVSEKPTHMELASSTNLDTGIETLTPQEDDNQVNAEVDTDDDGVASIASDDSTVVPLVAKERELRREQNEVNDQVHSQEKKLQPWKTRRT